MNITNGKLRLSTSLAVLGILFTGCAPTLDNVKDTPTMTGAIPKNYPVSPEELKPSNEATTPDGTSKSFVPPAAAPAPNKDATPIEASWKTFYMDNQLKGLIDVALKKNQDLNMIAQDIVIANNEIMARQGEYLPKVGLGGEAGLEKRGKYTSQGVSDSVDEWAPGKTVPEKLPIYNFGVNMSWELDIWGRLRGATKAAALRYLSSIDGKNFLVTKLVAEVANTYYELLAFDKQMEIIKTNIEIQTEALQLVRLQKEAARVTSLAVKRFEAEVLKNRGRQYELRQKIVQTENRLNQLLGRMPQPITRNATDFINIAPRSIESGVPTKLLSERPDVKQAEHNLEASKIEVSVAKKRFYPALSMEANAGYESFRSGHLLESPTSVFYNIAGNLTAPLLNRKAIKADYFSANARQIQAVYDYDRAVITAYTDVVNQLSMISNMQRSYEMKSKQVAALTESVEISGTLFRAARADYVEVLMTRRDALDAQIELIEVKKQLLTSYVNLYQALGGGWHE